MNKFKLSVTISLIYCAILTLSSVGVRAISSNVMINEVLVDTSESASAEFIELTNTSNNIVDLEGWVLEYMPAGGHDWREKAELVGLLSAGSRYLVVTEELGVLGNQTASLGLARSGGHIRLMDNTQVVIDQLGWGTAIDPETAPTPAGPVGNSLKRLANEDGRFIDSDNNNLDFVVSSNPTPDSSVLPTWPVCEGTPVEETPPDETLPEEDDSEEEAAEPEEEPVIPPADPTVYATVEISELLIDPAAPATDKDDEFVELHNPHDFSIDLTGYTLQSGSSFQYSYVLPELILDPGDYFALFSIDTKLTLSNSAGVARLLDPNGITISETDAYQNAKPSKTWALFSENWLWSDLPTPHQPNQLTETASGDDTTKLARRTAVLASTSDNDSSSSSNTPANITSYEEPETYPSKINTTVLVLLGVVALLYSLYEYRNEIRTIFLRVRGYLRHWRQNRSST